MRNLKVSIQVKNETIKPITSVRAVLNLGSVFFEQMLPQVGEGQTIFLEEKDINESDMMILGSSQIHFAYADGNHVFRQELLDLNTLNLGMNFYNFDKLNLIVHIKDERASLSAEKAEVYTSNLYS